MPARPGGALVGFAELSTRAYAEGCETERVGFLEGWYTARDVRGTGVGRALVETALGWARGQGCVEFASDSVPQNEASRRAHLACGFEEVGLVRCYRMRLDGRPKRPRRRYVVGVDLSGLANTHDTAVAVFRVTATSLRLLKLRTARHGGLAGATDRDPDDAPRRDPPGSIDGASRRADRRGQIVQVEQAGTPAAPQLALGARTSQPTGQVRHRPRGCGARLWSRGVALEYRGGCLAGRQ